MAEVASAVTDQMVRDGATPPPVIAHKPKLKASLVGYMDAFHELDSERTHGMSLARIPWSSIVAYGEYYGLDVDELVYFVRAMDDAHLAKLRKGSSGDGGSTGSSTVVQRPPRPD